ncbi:hypothetical protein DCO47_20410 [Pseudomonas sp. NDM]|nr:hypothetical protein DCO47_20410 [Pseudomonas sp. NDM]
MASNRPGRRNTSCTTTSPCSTRRRLPDRCREDQKPPHPSPLPEGEGADPGIFAKHTDLKWLYRIHSRLGLSGRCMTQDILVSPLSLRERVRVRGFCLSAFSFRLLD